MQVHAHVTSEEKDLPIEAPFAPLRLPLNFWLDFVSLAAIGAFLGVFGVGQVMGPCPEIGERALPAGDCTLVWSRGF